MEIHLIIGGIFGFVSAVLGGLVDSQILSRRRQIDFEFSVGGPMLILAGIINSIIGVISIIVSLLVTGSLRNALLLGFSVLIGFATGFLLLAGLFIIRDR